jgi:hypothetical protein
MPTKPSMLAPILWLASVAIASPFITCSGFEIASDDESINDALIITSSISCVRALQDKLTKQAARGNLTVFSFFMGYSSKKIVCAPNDRNKFVQNVRCKLFRGCEAGLGHAGNL